MLLGSEGILGVITPAYSFAAALSAVKGTLDPAGILNPGVLIG